MLQNVSIVRLFDNLHPSNSAVGFPLKETSKFLSQNRQDSVPLDRLEVVQKRYFELG
jgi:hypothetical protein